MGSRGYAAKDTQPRLRPRLHSHACIAKVTQSRIRSQGYAAKVTQPRLRPRLHCQDYTSPGDIIQVSKHPLFGVARWSHSIERTDITAPRPSQTFHDRLRPPKTPQDRSKAAPG